MKSFILLALVLTSSAIASEIERGDRCGNAVARVMKLQGELSELTKDIIRESGNSESSYAQAASPTNCEEVVPNISLLLARRDRINADLKVAQADRDRACPRSYPE